jgi:hypothetical protein
VGRIALAASVLAVLTAPPAVAAGTPRWTAKGPITKLSHRSITVHGKTCRIASDSPSIRVEIVGSAVRIVCDGGVLFEIDRLHLLPSVPGSQSSSSSSSSSVSSSTSSSSSSVSSTAIAGDFTVAASGGGSITVKGAGSFELTCTIGAGSPDTSGLAVGAHVSTMTCKNGVLTSLARP